MEQQQIMPFFPLPLYQGSLCQKLNILFTAFVLKGARRATADMTIDLAVLPLALLLNSLYC